MANAAAKTAIGPIALIAIEQYYPKEQRVIDDNLAYRMLPASVRVLVPLMKPRWMRNCIISLSEKSEPGIWGGLLCRKRYIDEKITDSCKDFDEVVNLGAGFDTRNFRLPSLSGIPIWEIDQPQNIKAKETRLLKILGEIPSNVRFLPVDFDHEDIATALRSRGYSTDKRTFFIMEAVTQYLTDHGMEKVFDFLSNAAMGSRLAFTYVCKDFLDGRSMYNWESGYKRFVLGNVWHYAMEPEVLPEFLKRYGWKVIEDRGYDELADEYLKPSGRELKSTPVERMVYAEKS